MSMLLEKLQEQIYQGDSDKVAELTQKALAEGLSPQEVLDEGLIRGLGRVGKDFRDGILFVPEVLLAARRMKAGIHILRPLLVEAGAPSMATFVIGTVKGDLHDIGKDLVVTMMEGAGFEVVDVGVDVPPERFVDAVRQNNAELVGMSALLTTTMVEMQKVIEALSKAGLQQKAKVMVGGAPVTQDFADQIGADGYARDAATAVDVARELLGSI